MNWLLNFVVIWLSISLFVVATGWYAAKIIAPRYPNWCRRVVADFEPDFPITQKQLRR
jgi:hypothetical protein